MILNFAMIGFRFIFAVFTLTILLTLAVYIRTSTDRICYEIASSEVQQNRLRQQLRQKQLQFEACINPTALLKSLSSEETRIRN